MKLIPVSHFTGTYFYYFFWLQASQRWEVYGDPERKQNGFLWLVAMVWLVLYLFSLRVPAPSHFPSRAAAPSSWHCSAPFALFSCKLLLRLMQPGTEMHQKGLCLPLHNPAASHPRRLLRPCPEPASWTCIFSFVKKHPESHCCLFSQSHHFSQHPNQQKSGLLYFHWEKKTYQVLCATAFLARHKTL